MTAASPSSDLDSHKQLVRRYFDAIGAADLDALAKLLAPDLRVRCAGGTGTIGTVEFESFEALADDIRHNLGELYDASVGIQPEILNLTAESDRVTAEVRIRGRSARTGAAYDNLYAFFFWIRAGTIVEIHEHLDTTYVGTVLLQPAGIASGAEMPWLGHASPSVTQCAQEDPSMHRFEGRVVIVTGAARGTGETTARRFAAEGATVVVADIRDELGDAVAKGIGGTARYVHLDVTLEADWARAMDTVTRELGRLDVLVNNAAILHLGPLAKTSLETWNRVVAVNQTGPFLGIRAAIEPMRASGGGSIVNIASIDGLEGMNGVSAYASTKWALRGLSRCAALELGRFGIRVNTVCPAGGNDEMSAPFRPPGIDAKGFLENRAIPRRASLDEIASMILFLCSDEGAFCTGSDYVVDGGHTSGTFVPGIANA